MKRPTLILLSLAFLLIGLLTIFFQQPSSWAKLRTGMTKAQVDSIVPNFDIPWNSANTAIEERKLFGLGWRLTVTMNRTALAYICIEFQIPGSPPETLWTSLVMEPEVVVESCNLNTKGQDAASDPGK